MELYPPVVCNPHPPSIVNILLLGKVGVGKSRIANEMFGQEIFKTGSPPEVVKGVSQRENCFSKNSTNYRVKIFDTVGRKRGPRVSRTNTMRAMRRYLAVIYPDGVNLVLLVFRNEQFSGAEKSRFKYILNRLNIETVPMVTALIITGCEDKNDSARKKIVSDFDTNSRMQEMGRFALQGMYAVGLTDIRAVPDAMVEMFRAVNYRDTLILKEILSHCYKNFVNMDMFFHRGRYHRGFCRFPWHYCLCYNRIYTCWRWGCTCDDCVQVPR
jgi:GTP-binding protein EngB required for normal cell division